MNSYNGYIMRLYCCGYSMDAAYCVYVSFVKKLDFDGLAEYVKAVEDSCRVG